jgi:cellulose synthase/poly-beta-1,6-N-acetylglucosamine synthase-like glycosyltransferase
MLVIDFFRTIGKCAFLLVHALYQRVRPPIFRSDFLPKVSLIIPAHNEEKIIVRAIESALETDYLNKEVIVVDDGSKDRTFQLAFPYSRKGLIKLLHRDVASGSKATALNYGLVFASGEVIVVVDADTLIERNSLREIVKPLSDPSISAVSGNVRIMGGEDGSRNLLVRLQAYEYLISLELGRRFSSIVRTLLIISGAFGAFWKENVRSLGEYDKDTITEDFDITFKMRKMGKRLYFMDRAISWTFAPETWQDWRRQRTRWTKGQAETLWKHRNVLYARGFDIRFFAAFFDMLFMDVFILFMRLTWFVYLLVFYSPTFIYITVFSFMLYLALELVAFVSAGLLSPRKSDLKYIYLLPIIVLFYRPYYSLIRMKAYLSWVLRRKSSW